MQSDVTFDKFYREHFPSHFAVKEELTSGAAMMLWSYPPKSDLPEDKVVDNYQEVFPGFDTEKEYDKWAVIKLYNKLPIY
jgi:hypothetical protein